MSYDGILRRVLKLHFLLNPNNQFRLDSKTNFTVITQSNCIVKTNGLISNDEGATSLNTYKHDELKNENYSTS